MAISKARKEELVGDYVELITQSRAIFITEYKGMSMKQIEALRGEIRKADGAFHVTKNTLFRHALEQADKPVPAELLMGQVATTFALNEAPSLAKVLTDYAKKEALFTIKGGILGNDLLTAAQVEALGKLPSLEELRAQILGLLSAPAQSLTSAVANGVRRVINVLDAYAKKDAEAAAVSE